MGVAVLAIPCGYVGWQLNIVQHRKAMLEIGKSPVVSFGFGDDIQIPVIRRWLGDRAVSGIIFGEAPSPETVRQYRKAFPEW